MAKVGIKGSPVNFSLLEAGGLLIFLQVDSAPDVVNSPRFPTFVFLTEFEWIPGGFCSTKLAQLRANGFTNCP